jgi:O-antigen/teichoic acid export membrane protein
MTLRSEVMSGLRWLVASRLAAQLATWAATVLIMRLLAPSDYGLMALGTFCIVLITLINEMGLGSALIQAKDMPREIVDRVFTLIFVVNVLLGGALAVAAPLVAGFFHEPKLTEVLRVLALQFLIIPWSTVTRSLLERQLAFRRKSILDMIVNVSGGLATLVLAYLGWGVWALVWGSLWMALARAVGFSLIAPYRPRFALSVRGTRRVLTFGGMVGLNQLLFFFYSQADVFIAGKLLGKEGLGLYSVAIEIASLPMQKVAGIFNQVALPAFSRIQEDRARVAANVVRAVRMMSLASLPVFWGISAVAPEIVLGILGEKWRTAVVPLQIVSLVVPLRMIGTLISPAVQAMGRADVSLGNLAIACLVMPTAFFFGAYYGREVGMSIAWVTGYPIVLGVILKRSGSVLGVRPTVILAALVKPGAGVALMYAAVMAARSLIPDTWGPREALAVLIPTGAVVYLGFTWVADRRSAGEFLGLLRA